MGGYTHPRDYKAAGCRHVCGRRTSADPTSPGTASLLRIWRAHRASRWLCRGGSSVLQRSTCWIGRRVHVQWNEIHVRLIDPRTGQLLREHLRQQRGRRRIQEDKPARTPLSTEQLLRRAEVSGEHMGALCRAMHNAQGQAAVRRNLGVLSLTKKYGIRQTRHARWDSKPVLASTGSSVAISSDTHRCR